MRVDCRHKTLARHGALATAMQNIFDFLLHLDRYLAAFAQHYGLWVYALLFIIIFAETGLVVTPFLPGDTLIFVTGALVASGHIYWPAAVLVFLIGAILGNLSNYEIGRALGPRVFTNRSRWLNKRHLEEAHAYFTRYGAITIIIARFLPIIRTFVPFVAGIGRMSRLLYFAYTVAGAALWVSSIFIVGVFFGNIPFVKNNLTLIVLGAVVVSLIPALVIVVRKRFRHPAENE
ncbi:MAG: VTT domain-containing protein [Gammaproteobacteria bacterium]